MGYEVIRFTGVSRAFGQIRALADVSFAVPPGCIFGLLGPNGAGKTTVIRTILGLLEPGSGTVEVFGMDTLKDPQTIRSMTGAVLESTGLYERLTVEDYLWFYGRVWHMENDGLGGRIGELLQKTGLVDRRKSRIADLSRGMKQKLAIARAIIHKPSLLLLDEPTLGLDPSAAAALREYIVEMVRQEGMTILLATNNLSEAENLCAMVAVLNRGGLVACGTMEDILKGGSGESAAITVTGLDAGIVERIRSIPSVRNIGLAGNTLSVELEPGGSLSSVIRALVENNCQVEEATKRRVHLEDVFLNLTREGP